MEILHASQVGVLLARIAAEQKELRCPEVVVCAQVGVAGGDGPTSAQRRDGVFLDTRASGLPFAIPALTIADLDLLQDAMGFVEVSPAKLRYVHNAGCKVIRPAFVVGKVAKHRHDYAHSLD